MDLLEYSCLWAYGESGAAACRRALTEGLYTSGRAYLPTSGPQLIERISGSLYRLDLTKALDFPTGHLDCQDVNGLLSVKMQSLGINAGNLLITHIDSNGDPWFWTNPVDPMGWPLTQQYGFVFHWVSTSSTLVCDATTAHPLDLNGQSYAKPPSNWNLAGYWQTPSGSVIYGLARSTSNPSIYQVISMYSHVVTITLIL